MIIAEAAGSRTDSDIVGMQSAPGTGWTSGAGLSMSWALIICGCSF